MSVTFRTSVRECVRIANLYEYKVELVRTGSEKYYIILSENILNSPYPNVIYSRLFGDKTLDRLKGKKIL